MSSSTRDRLVATTPEFRQLAKDVALHIASAKPIAVRVEDVPADVLERERRVYKAQVVEEKKPDAVKDKIVEGKLRSSSRRTCCSSSRS